MTQTELLLTDPQPRVVDFEAFAVKRHAAMTDLGEAALHKAHTRQSRRQRQRQLDAQRQRDHEWATRRAQARNDYADMIARGEIRKLTRRERLERTAQGHPDNPSVQAARRLLARMDATTANDID
ncbi:hypothetical protein [Salinisphaera sp. T31B1]|uniref:hypothetical protein n=1 Tax=Salinisphaera sp. T31B1 TaxID=727963 RepID=UPI0033429891